jgi:2',3'-cyclic-nucleotide 2'-phosphodiesterase (5'-nucleotidase family)
LIIAAPAFVANAFGDTIQVASDLSTRNVKAEESSLADIFADAIRDSEKTDSAFIAASSFEEITIKRGTTSTAEVLKALSFHDHTIAVVKLTGEQIKKAMEHALGLIPTRSSYFLQVSGMAVTIDPHADKGQRVMSLRIGGTSYSPTKVYTVAMPAPLANGALAFHTIWSKAAIDASRSGSKTLAETVTAYLAGKRTIGDQTEERLVFKK